MVFIKTSESYERGISNILRSTELPRNIEKGEYALILGEDSSARLHTLFLKEVVGSLCVANNVPKPATQFFCQYS